LVFLLPLLLLYELGSILFLSDPGRGVVETIGARSILGGFFEAWGGASLHLPAVALTVVLLCWHVFERDPWRIRPRVLLAMLVESVLWTLPLLVFGLLLAMDRPPPAAGVAPPTAALGGFSWQARLTLSAGAGIYEELLFRLILITAIHFVLVDLLRLSQGVGFVVAAVVSAVAFALYHNISHPGGGANLALLAFYTAAGLYFATLFIFRGFGIVVAAHALYDVVVLVAIDPANW